MMPNQESFQVYEDTATGRIALVCPSPVAIFDTLEDFKDWVYELLDSLNKHQVSDKGEPLKQAYADTVIEEWQKLLVKNQLNGGPQK